MAVLRAGVQAVGAAEVGGKLALKLDSEVPEADRVVGLGRKGLTSFSGAFLKSFFRAATYLWIRINHGTVSG